LWTPEEANVPENMEQLSESIIEIVRRTSAEIPDDVQRAILAALENEKEGTIAESAMKIIEQNIELAKKKFNSNSCLV
jgi:fumarate hydratase class I